MRGSNWCVKMAKKNLLREIKSISSIPKSKVKDVFAYSDYWEAWELCGDDENDPDNWSFLEDGSFEDCLEQLRLHINIELDRQLTRERYADTVEHPQEFFDEMSRRYQLRVEEITKQCFQTGEYITPYWSLRSMLNRDQCEYISKYGNPCPNSPPA